MAARVMIDPELCIGSGECVRLVPTAFWLDEKRGVSVTRPGAGDVPNHLLYDAENGCPTGAITIGDETSER